MRPMRRTFLARAVACVVAGGLGSAGAFAHPGHAHAPVATAGLAPPKGVRLGGVHTLADQHGNAFTLGAPSDRATLLLFGFTSCPSVCPTGLADAAAVVARLPDDHAPRIVFVTLDPERDRPEVLREYVASFDPRIVALGGREEDVAAVAASYRVSHRRVPTGASWTIEHSAFAYLLDARGAVVRLYAHGTPPAVIAGEIERAGIARTTRRR
jgi:protein SCO1/2